MLSYRLIIFLYSYILCLIVLLLLFVWRFGRIHGRPAAQMRSFRTWQSRGWTVVFLFFLGAPCLFLSLLGLLVLLVLSFVFPFLLWDSCSCGHSSGNQSVLNSWASCADMCCVSSWNCWRARLSSVVPSLSSNHSLSTLLLSPANMVSIRFFGAWGAKSCSQDTSQTFPLTLWKYRTHVFRQQHEVLEMNCCIWTCVQKCRSWGGALSIYMYIYIYIFRVPPFLCVHGEGSFYIFIIIISYKYSELEIPVETAGGGGNYHPRLNVSRISMSFNSLSLRRHCGRATK